jgi:hypothetical protein
MNSCHRTGGHYPRCRGFGVNRPIAPLASCPKRIIGNECQQIHAAALNVPFANFFSIISRDKG